jgi:hypothetical protein
VGRNWPKRNWREVDMVGRKVPKMDKKCMEFDE